MAVSPARLGVLVSGGGRSLENLVERGRDGRLPAEVALVVANRADAGALARAERLGVPSCVLRPRDHADEGAFGEAVFRRLEEAEVDLAVLAGYLVRLPMRDGWRGRVLNIHPALLPSFGGRGYYGHHVHEAVVRAGVKVTGCTVHFVDDEYDHGPILLQRTVPVAYEDTPDDVAARVFEAEKEALPEAIRLVVEGRAAIVDGRVRIDG